MIITREMLIYYFSVGEMVKIWNEFAIENGWRDDELYENTQEGYELVFTGDNALDDLARAVHYGDFHYRDSYFKMNSGVISSFSELDELVERIDIDELVKWLNSGNADQTLLEEIEYIIKINKGEEE